MFIMFFVAALFCFIFLTIAENSFYGLSKKKEEESLPRTNIFTGIPVLGYLYTKIEDKLSAFKFLMSNDFQGLILVGSYSVCYAIIRTAVIILRKVQPTDWYVGEGFFCVILILMLLALMARFIYVGDRFFTEFLPFTFVAIVTGLRARQAACYASIMAHGLFAKLIQIIPVVILVLVVVVMLISYIIARVSRKNDHEKTSA